MNREIYTYIDLRYLEAAPFWRQIKRYPQITVTADLRKSLKGNIMRDKVAGLFRDDLMVQAREFRNLVNVILPHWTDDETKFREMVVLSQYIRERIAKAEDNPEIRHWLIGCRRNLGMILSAILLLEEAGIAPEDIQENGDRNIGLLLEAWRFLKENDPTIGHFHKRMKELTKRDAWNPVLNQLFGKSDISTLIFHGFYYFTPLQERIMRLLETAGIRLIFLFAYDEKYPYANEIWRKTYSVEKGYPKFTEWHMEKSDRTESYGEIFEGRKAKITNKLQIKEYASVMDFVQGMKQVKEQGYFIYSSNSSRANEILRDFYPEEYGERKLLSYPIGQFVSILNQMWDEDLQQIVLDADRLIECFASGWLSLNGVSGKQYLQDVTNLVPFFSDCRTVEEWKKRIALLRDIEENVVTPFIQDLGEDGSKARWQEIMGNPFLNFSIFATAPDRLELILNLIEQLLAMADELFGDGHVICVQDHIQKLDRILKRHEMSNDLYEEERELIKDLFEKLGDSSGSSTKVYPADVSSALNLYMNGRFQEGEIQTNRIGLVSPIYQIDAAAVKQHGKVHICLCDVEHMPGGRKEYIWPLTGRHIRDCYERTKNPLIVNLQHVMESASICNRYFMYAALKNKDVQLSWISNLDDKILAPSPYIKLVCEAAGMSIVSAKRNTITYSEVQRTEFGRGRVKPYDITKMPMDTAKEAKMDYAICPMKYAFGYVVEKFPAFQSEFHQNYAVNGLIAAIYSLMKTNGASAEEVYQNVMELFPAMRRAEKRQVYDYLQYESSFQDEDCGGYSELADVFYPDERLKVKFPNKNVRRRALDRYEKLQTPNGRIGMNFYKTAADEDTNPYKKSDVDVCLFCQHQNYCRYAVFAADMEALYD